MKYPEFQNTFKERSLIDVREVRAIFPDFESRRFYEWQKKGYIKKLSNLFYVFVNKKNNENEINFIANKLLEPSYISLESAMRFYNLIPEVVFLITNVTTRKTKLIQTPVGNYQYKKIKSKLFFGYKIIDYGANSFKIAEPEKALLDFLYFRSDINDENALIELRINEDTYRKIIDQKKLNSYLEIFDSVTLSNKIKILNKILKI